jgi:hypothetical protein
MTRLSLSQLAALRFPFRIFAARRNVSRFVGNLSIGSYVVSPSNEYFSSFLWYCFVFMIIRFATFFSFLLPLHTVSIRQLRSRIWLRIPMQLPSSNPSQPLIISSTAAKALLLRIISSDDQLPFLTHKMSHFPSTRRLLPSAQWCPRCTCFLLQPASVLLIHAECGWNSSGRSSLSSPSSKTTQTSIPLRILR